MKALTGLPTQVYAQAAEESGIPVADLLQLVQAFESNLDPTFIARYRPDISAGRSESQIRSIQTRLREFSDLADRKVAVLTSLTQQGRLTAELRTQVESVRSRRELEDLAAPFRQRPRSAADDAVDAGLEGLARFLWSQQPGDLAAEAAKFVAPEKGVADAEAALAGARGIVARWLAENSEVRSDLRRLAADFSAIVVDEVPIERKLSAKDNAARSRYGSLFGKSFDVNALPWKQVLNLRRGVREGWLLYRISIPRDRCLEYLRRRLIQDPESAVSQQLEAAIESALDETLASGLEATVRQLLEERCDSEAIASYTRNLERTLMQAPAGNVTVIGIEVSRPGGWRAAVIGPNGELLESAIVRSDPTAPEKASEAEQTSPPEKAASEAPPVSAADAEQASPAESERTEAEASVETATSAEAVAEPAETAGSDSAAPDAAGDASAPAAEPAVTSDEGPAPSEAAPSEPSEAPVTEAAPAEAEVEPVLAAEPAVASEEIPASSEAPASEPSEALVAEAPDEAAAAPESAPAEAEDETASESSAAPAIEEQAAPEAEAAAAESPSGAEASKAAGAPESAATEPAPEAASADARAPSEKGTRKSRKHLERIHTPVIELAELIRRHNPEFVVLGNGPRVRQAERFVRAEIKKSGVPATWVTVSEAGSWIYATSRAARHEFPKEEPAVRAAACLARRLQDPLAESVKLDLRILGVGQGHHEVDQKSLRDALRQQASACACAVGVDLNRAPAELLELAPGITDRVAKRIVEHRRSHGPFPNLASAEKVSGMNQRVWEQASGFLRVRGSDNPLDETGVRPEHYAKAQEMLAAAGVSLAEPLEHPEKLSGLDLDPLASQDFPRELLESIVAELAPARVNPRGSFRKPKRASELEPLVEPKMGMKVEGLVANSASFGVFVDVGAEQDGLLHVSQLPEDLVADNRPKVKPGTRLTVYISHFDASSGKLSLTLKEPRETSRQRRTAPAARKQGPGRERLRDGNGWRKSERRQGPMTRTFGPDENEQALARKKVENMTLNEKLAALGNKFRTKV